MIAIDTASISPLVSIVGWTLLHFIWQGALIAIAAASLLVILRRAAPGKRYAVACVGLAACALAPLVTFGVLTNSARFDQLAFPADRGLAATLPDTRADALAPGAPAAEPTLSTASIAESSVSAEAIAANDVANSSQIHRSPDETWLSAVPRVVEPYLGWIVGLWAFGVCCGAARVAAGWLITCRWRRRCTRPVPPAWQACCQRLVERLRLSRSIRLLESSLIDSPMVVGVLRPMILLPASALSGFSPAQVEAILAHELAHIRRRDPLLNALQTILETLLFYHPAVWSLSTRARREREFCCDDLALSICRDRALYARTLADLEAARAAQPLAIAATSGPLLLRIRRILGAPPAANSSAASWLTPTLALTPAIAAAVAFWLPQEKANPADAGSTARFVSDPAYVPIPEIPEPTNNIFGFIIDEDGKPVAETSVIAIGGQMGAETARLRTTTDATGRFEFDALAVGETWCFVVDDERFARHWDSSDCVVTRVEAGTLPLRLTVFRPRTLHGTVVDETGQPVERVKVTLCREILPGGKTPQGNLASSLQETETDAQGKFRFERVRPAKAVLFLERAGFAKTLPHENGGAVDVDGPPSTLVIRKGLTLRGSVRADGKLLPEVTLRVTTVKLAHRDMGSWSVRTDVDGRFSIENVTDLSLTDYIGPIAHVSIDDSNWHSAPWQVYKNDDGTLPACDLEALSGPVPLTSPHPLPVVVGRQINTYADADQPKGTAVVRVETATGEHYPLGLHTHLRLISLTPTIRVRRDQPSTIGKTVEFRDLPAAIYSVRATVHSGAAYENQIIYLEDGSTIDVRLIGGPAQLSGRITSNGEIVVCPSAVVRSRDLMPDGEGHYAHASDLANGEYALYGLPAGRYELMVCPRDGVSNTFPVEVRKPETVYNIELPQASIVGRITGVTKSPTSALNGYITRRNLPLGASSAFDIDDQGRFELRYLEPDTYNLTVVAAAGNRPAVGRARITSATDRVVIEIKPVENPGAIGGFVRGLPVVTPYFDWDGGVHAFPKDADGYDCAAGGYSTIRRSDGGFELRDIAPGRYGILIGAYNREVVPLWLPDLEVRPGLMARIEAELTPMRPVALQFVRPEGSRARYRLQFRYGRDGDWLPAGLALGQHIASTLNTDSESIRIAPGWYAIESRIEDGATVVHEFEVIAGEGIQPIRIALP